MIDYRDYDETKDCGKNRPWCLPDWCRCQKLGSADATDDLAHRKRLRAILQQIEEVNGVADYWLQYHEGGFFFFERIVEVEDQNGELIIDEDSNLIKGELIDDANIVSFVRDKYIGPR
jgi:hypothetical protein